MLIRPINMRNERHNMNDQGEKNNYPTDNCYCSVRGIFLRKTARAILLIKNQTPHWFPFSVLHVENPLIEESVITIDIPRWMARKHDLAVSYAPVTQEGQRHNERLGYADLGVPQPSFDILPHPRQAEDRPFKVFSPTDNDYSWKNLWNIAAMLDL